MRTRDTNKEDLVKQNSIAMIVAQGVEGFGMNRLAKESGVSVATLYIYYADKDDLIKKIGVEMGRNFFTAAFKDLSPDEHFVEGLRKQWNNRTNFVLNNPVQLSCFELLRHSSYGQYILEESEKEFKTIMTDFLQNAIRRKELIPISKDVFWSIAYGPLYSMLRFHIEGKSMGGAPFKLTQKAKDEAFELVIKALTL